MKGKSDLEMNKIAAAILLASLIAMVVGTVADILYKPKIKLSERGYSIEVEESSANGDVKEEVPFAELLAKADSARGKTIAGKCLSCHGFEKGGPNKIGPNLWNSYGANKGHHAGYAYSAALLAKGGVWDDESLYEFLHKPSSFIPGTKMSFIGLRKREDIADVIAYLKEQKG